MKIPIEITTSRRFRYLWLKSIHAFDPRVHCARCLKGSYHDELNPQGMWNGDTVRIELELDTAPIHYLCGVTNEWAKNLHLPFESRDGALPLEIVKPGVSVRFPQGGIRLLPIMEPISGIDPAYGTCRNWLFGLGHLATEEERNAAIASLARPYEPVGSGRSNS